jgi:Asp-tRNA(Asn)/Glu-tRNA(Gln) amidotransferase A subunit family amidase
LGEVDGLPVGMQLMGAQGSDEIILEMIREME